VSDLRDTDTAVIMTVHATRVAPGLSIRLQSRSPYGRPSVLNWSSFRAGELDEITTVISGTGMNGG
jgi:hypothetical protein